MRTELLMAAVLAAGGATAAGVAACGSDSTNKRRPATAATTASTAKQSTVPAAPVSLQVRVQGRRQTLKVADISFAYCRQHARTCAAVKRSQQAGLTPNQRNAIKAAVVQVRAQGEAARHPVPAQPAPEPAPEPAPQPEPQGGGETTTG